MKPSVPKGMRDFGAEEVQKRNYIINTIRGVYEQFGYQPLETPSMENLSTLTGKYGDEGDKLLYRVLNSGDFLRRADKAALANADYMAVRPAIAEKGLRYDLTIPFARYVVMNRGTLTFPFKRYQIQPVWRADRPQKGRYREFYQCDADVIGSRSLLNEAELTQILDMVFSRLGVNVIIHLNNRKILAGIAEVMGMTDKITAITVAIDKLDKIGMDKVLEELRNRGIADEALDKLKVFLGMQGSIQDKIQLLETQFADSEIGQKGIAELKTLFAYLQVMDLQNEVRLDITLARGLDYYTGTIYEVKACDVKMGSISGGGRYDDLTGTFGLKDMSGVGISFGLDRIYDVMNELGLFDAVNANTTKVLFINFGGESEAYAFNILQQCRAAGIAAEIYPDAAKMKKQMKYANTKNIPFVVFTGQQEMDNRQVSLKNMTSGEQQTVAAEDLLTYLNAH